MAALKLTAPQARVALDKVECTHLPKVTGAREERLCAACTDRARVLLRQFHGDVLGGRPIPRPRAAPSATPQAALRHVMRISNVQYDAPGPEAENLGREWVELRNAGTEPVAIGDWTLSDAQNHIYTFAAGTTVAGGDRMRLHTGIGQDARLDVYWGRRQAVWNNTGDTATLRDEKGRVVDAYKW